MLTFGQWINNQDTPSLDGDEKTTALIEVENPTDGTIVGTVPAGGPLDAQAALEAARKAQPAWAKTPAKQRAQLLKDLANIVRANRDALAETLASEQSKEWGLATVEIDAAATYYDMYAGFVYSFPGEILQSDNAGENM